jgi:uncharacterized membrane protein YqjE
MTGNNIADSGPIASLLRLTRTGVGALRNRGELLAVEWQEEQARLREMFFWTVGFLFFMMMGMVLLTGTIIFLFPAEGRVYAAGGFALLYLLGAVGAWLALKKHLKHESFSESLNQIKKDAEWLDSLK